MTDKPTLAEFKKHFDKYGLDNSHTATRRRPARYGNFNALKKDSAVVTACQWLTDANFVAFIEYIGYAKFADDAGEWWKAERVRWKEERAEFDAIWPEEKGVTGGESEFHDVNPPNHPL